MPDRLLIVHDEELGLDFGPEHPGGRRRHRLAVALCRESGLLDAPGVGVEPGPGPLSDAELERTFAPAFVGAIRRYSARPALAAEWEAAQWGIDRDNGAFAGMHEAAARLAAASTRAARAVAAGRPRRAFVPAGGTHHGLANRAAGFGIYNDSAAAVNALVDGGCARVAYVDLDVHHGNGTQAIFYADPDVLTISVHEDGRHLFPGSGFPHETGAAGAEGRSVNVALPPGAGDEAYLEAFARVVAPLVRAFAPDALVTQCGVDSHHADPLSHLRTTMPLFPRLWRGLGELAAEAAGGRWLALGGGGYEHCSVPPRAWALLVAEQAGAGPRDPLPAPWRAEARALGCGAPPETWLEDAGPADGRPDAPGTPAIERTLGALAPYWPGLAP